MQERDRGGEPARGLADGPLPMSNMKDVWETGGELDPASRVGGEKRQFRDYQPPDYDPRQRRRTDDSFAIATQQVRCARHLHHYISVVLIAPCLQACTRARACFC